MKIYVIIHNGYFPIRAYKIKENAQEEADKLSKEQYLATIENHFQSAIDYGSDQTREDVIKEVDGWYNKNPYSVIEINLEE